MAEFIPYPETLDLRRLTKEVHRYRPETGKVDFTGTVKVHGTNITVVFRNNGSHRRSNCGAAAFLTPWLGKLGREVERTLGKQYAVWKEIMVTGEFAGRGIQKGVDVVDASVRLEVGVEEGRIFNIFDFQTFKVTIDFTPRRRVVGQGTVQEGIVDQEDACIEKMGELALLQRDGDGEAKEGDTDKRSEFTMVEDVERMTQAVEDECPVALKMGGVRHGVGEGIVWVEESLVPLESPLRFKSKGPKHMIVGKKIPQKQGPGDNAKKENVNRFVAYAVTDVRLRQGLERLTEGHDGESVMLDKKNIPRLHEWVMADMVKEEGDLMKDMGLTQNEVGKEVMRRVKKGFENKA